jgi:hypothetical protein
VPKVDKTQYTKDEWKVVRDQRRLEKMKEEDATAVSKNQTRSNYVVCLKHGNKYDAEYVNVLYNMVQRNLTIEHEFVCFTEDPIGINPNIRIEPLPIIPDATGWWYKPLFFNPKLQLQGTILYLDLDVIVFNNIDNLFTYKPGTFCIIKDFNRSLRHDWKKYNSSVFRLDIGDHPQVYENFLQDTLRHMRRLHGDQDWMFEQIRRDFSYWPNEWIQSYKWEMRRRPAMVRDGNGNRNFATAGSPTVLPETNIAVFHGQPNPKDCIDQWCKDHWY